MASQSAGNEPGRGLPMLATALKREMVAIRPCPVGEGRRVRWSGEALADAGRNAYRPALDGHLCDTRIALEGGHIAGNIDLGVAGQRPGRRARRSRPAQSGSAPVCSAGTLASGDAWTPAAQTLVAASMRRRPATSSIDAVGVPHRQPSLDPWMDRVVLGVGRRV